MKERILKFASVATAFALLAVIPGTAMAQEANTPKEEVIYASLAADGSFQKAYVVNSFDLSQAGQVIDFGNYDSVTNLTTTDQIGKQGDQITANAPEGRFFYQGDLSSLSLPWSVSVTYSLDGSPAQPGSLAGAKGRLEINIQVKNSSQANRAFTGNYMLQTSMTLNTEKCSNITANGATVANSGKNKVINFVKMPDNEGDYTVTMDVQDFEMQGIQISALPLSLGISTPDTGDLTSGIGDLQDGIGELDSGAEGLSSGAQQLSEGSGSVTKGLQEFQGGLGQIQSGLASLVAGNPGLQGGSQQILDALKQIQANLSSMAIDTSDLSSLATGSAQIASAISQLAGSFAGADAGISSATGGAYSSLHAANQAALSQLSGITDPSLQALLYTVLGANDQLIFGNGTASNPGLSAGMAALNTQYATFNAGIQELPTKLASMASGMTQLKGGIDQLVSNYASFNGGLVQYTNGAKSLYDGYGELCEGFNKIVQGSAQLSQGASSLADGTREFSGGMNELNSQTQNMDSDVQEQIDEMMKTYTGGDFTPVSFVSDKNTNIKSVQFVLMTQEIKTAKAEEVQQQPAEQTFWDKLATLFGVKK